MTKLVQVAKVAVEKAFGVNVVGERVFVLGGFDGAKIIDGKKVVSLPKGAMVAAVDAEGTIAALSHDGKRVGDRYTWRVELWSLAPPKKIALLSENHPDDKTEPEVIVGDEIVCLRSRTRERYSLRTFDRKGRPTGESPLGKVKLPFRVAASRDGAFAATAYFTGAAHLFDRKKKKGAPLVGGTLRIGRQHEKGIDTLAFDDAGEHVMSASRASRTVHVWSTRTKKSVSGPWQRESVAGAFFVAGGLATITFGERATLTHHAFEAKAKPRAVAEADRFAPMGDGRHVVIADSGEITIVDVGTGARVAAVKGPKEVHALAASPVRVAVLDAKNLTVFAVR